MARKIALLTVSDLSKVQGSTEASYVADFLAENYDTHIYSRFDPEIDNATYHRIPDSSMIPALLLYNILLFPYFFYQNYRHDFDLFYTYSGFHLTPYVISQLNNCEWIADFQTKPTGQAKEWSKSSGAARVVTDLYYKLFDILYRLTLPHAKAIVALSDPVRDDLQESYNVDSERIQIVPLGVDSDRFRPKNIPEGYTEPLDIVYVGSMASQRRIDMCIRAIASEDLEIDVRLHLVGDGSSEDLRQLQKTAQRSKVENRVEWHGYVDHESIPAVLDEMDASISPLPAYNSYKVSSPAKIYEYLSMGLPIICSDIRAHSHLLIDGETGFFFEPGSLSSLVTAINRIGLCDPATWREIRKFTRQKGQYHDWSNRFKAIEAVIEDAQLDRS